MKNYAALIISSAHLIGMGFGFSSCKEDEPPVPPKLSFAESTMTVGEDAGSIEIVLVLDKPYGKDLNVEFSLGGTASDQQDVGTADADYQVVGDHDVVTIPSGQTTGAIKIDIIPDAVFETDETLEISIVDVNTADVEVTAEDQVVVTITNDDAQAVASFAVTTLTANEADGADGLLAVTVQLDVPAPTDITIEYTLENSTAIDSLIAATTLPDPIPPRYYDFYVNSETHEVIIAKGESSADIEIQLLSDFMYEGDEVIEITLTGSSAASIGTNSTMKITLTQEDGKAIALLWDPTYTDVDMDMFLWFGEDIDNLNGLLALAINPDTEIQEEIIFFPTALSAGITGLAFGLSYVYYEGTKDPMNFEVHFADFAGGVLEPEADRNVYAASYTLANINPWFESKVDPVVVQTFKIVNGAYTEFSDITVPASGSRMKTQQLPEGLQRTKMRPSARLPL